MTASAEPNLAHLSLEDLRRHRRALLAESATTLYWRRLVQARIDLAVAGTAPPETLARPCLMLPEPPDTGALRELVGALPDDPIGLLQRLHLAQRALSGYGVIVHAAASAATGELVERYAARPTDCLAAAPTRE